MGRADRLELGMKKCNSCSEIKPLSSFYKRNGRPCGVKSKCKQCCKEYNQSMAKEIKAKRHDYYLKNKAQFRASGKKWKQNNKERSNAQAVERRKENPEISRAHCEKWRKNNLDKDAKRAQDYRVKKISAKPKWANDKYILLWYKLAKIEEIRTGRKVHVDHIVPLRGKLVCGLHCEDNMQLLFAEENSRKGNRYGQG